MVLCDSVSFVARCLCLLEIRAFNVGGVEVFCDILIICGSNFKIISFSTLEHSGVLDDSTCFVLLDMEPTQYEELPSPSDPGTSLVVPRITTTNSNYDTSISNSTEPSSDPNSSLPDA